MTTPPHQSREQPPPIRRFGVDRAVKYKIQTPTQPRGLGAPNKAVVRILLDGSIQFTIHDDAP
jgi:hypothetical protein